tara:strand:+ start:23925 stop:24824 length:900 start_codon:yes stop_codon:yes gene_type:complete
MIYDSVVTTGRAPISGCSSPDMGADIAEKRNVSAINSASNFYYDRDLTTGLNLDTGRSSIRLSLNGQTLQQEIPQEIEATNQRIYQIFTGDFFTKSESAPILERTTLNFDHTTPAKPTSTIIYNIITGGIFAGEKDFGRSLKTGILNGIGTTATAGISFSDFDYFLNGQKVYSGQGVGVFLGPEFAGLTATGFQPSFSTAANVNGVVIDERKTNFKYTSSKKSENTLSATGVSPDMKGQKFIEKRTNFYINGVEELQSNYLELYSGVITIKSGVSATLPSSGFEPYVVGGENSTEQFIL